MALAVTALLGACARPERAPAELRVERTSMGADTKVSLIAVPGLKINARLKPALELTDGTVLRFDSPRLTADSAYFAEPPVAVVAGRHRIRGTLRASVCGIHEQLCRSVTLEL